MAGRFILLRGITRVAIMLAGLVPAGVIAQSQLAKPDQIVINDSGGAMQSAMRKIFYSDFEQRNGIKILNTSPIDLGELKAMVTTATSSGRSPN